MQKYYKVFQHYMKKKIPHVLIKFEELGITPDMFLLEWVYTLFSRYFDIDNVSRIMSIYLLGDDSFIFRFGLAILISIEKKIRSDNMDEVASVINNLMQNIEYASVMKAYEGLRITEHDINKLRNL